MKFSGLLIFLANVPCKGSNFDYVLPHEWRICKVSKKLHKYCYIKIPMKNYITEHGECIEFCDIVDITIKLCNMFGLKEVVRKQAIDMAITLDGSQMTNTLYFVMTGIQFIDLAVQNPLIGKY